MMRFQTDDQVRLTRDIGTIKAGTLGVVVEVYESGLPGMEGDMDALFDYAIRLPDAAWVTPVREGEIELAVDGVDPKRYSLIAQDVLAVRWDANTGHEGAKALANWVKGKFVFDELQPEKTYYWAIEVSHHSGYFLRTRPGKYILKHTNGDIRTMNADTFISTYELEK